MPQRLTCLFLIAFLCTTGCKRKVETCSEKNVAQAAINRAWNVPPLSNFKRFGYELRYLGAHVLLLSENKPIRHLDLMSYEVEEYNEMKERLEQGIPAAEVYIVLEDPENQVVKEMRLLYYWHDDDENPCVIDDKGYPINGKVTTVRNAGGEILSNLFPPIFVTDNSRFLNFYKDPAKEMIYERVPDSDEWKMYPLKESYYWNRFATKSFYTTELPADTTVKDVVDTTHSKNSDPVDSNTPASVSIVPAAFPGGSQAMETFIKENLVYPKWATELKVEGDVLLLVKVKPDGSLSYVRTIRSSVNFECDNEAIRIIELMPKWSPAMQGETPVESFVKITVIFKLPDTG